MNNRVILFVITFALLEIKTIYAQDSTKSTSGAIETFNLFREPSYILVGQGFGNIEPLIFEGNLVSHFMLCINKNVKWGIELTPRIVLRMYNKDSYPVRTPSFKPGITFFYQLIDHENKKRDIFTFVSWFHHSNGQDGDFYNVDSTAINTTAGSFSTNCIEGGLFLARPNPILPYSTSFVKLSVRYNYSIDENLDGIYGRIRLFWEYKNSFNLSKAFKIFKIKNSERKVILTQSLRFGWICQDLPNVDLLDKKRFLFNYTLSFNPSFLNDVTLFMQYDYGQDDYNIYFNRSLNALRFGLASNVKFFN